MQVIEARRRRLGISMLRLLLLVLAFTVGGAAATDNPSAALQQPIHFIRSIEPHQHKRSHRTAALNQQHHEKDDKVKRIIIIGGGAAGFFSSIQAGRGLKGVKDAEVVLLESTKKLLNKVSISGGGRCNVMHDHSKQVKEIVQGYPRGQRELLGPYTSAFGPQETYRWFTSEGIKLKLEPDGRMFPITDQSQTIVDCLRNAASKAGVHIITGAKVRVINVVETSGKFSLSVEKGGGGGGVGEEGRSKKGLETWVADRVMLATGSNKEGHRLARDLGHSIVDPVPSLFTFEVKGDERIQGLAGVSVAQVELRLLGPAQVEGGAKVLKQVLKEAGLKQAPVQRGPLLITHSGFSGPAVLRLSAFGARAFGLLSYKARISVDWAPNAEKDEIIENLSRTKATYLKKAITTFCPQTIMLSGGQHKDGEPEAILPRRLWARLVVAAGIAEETTWGSLSPKALKNLVDQIKGTVFVTTGKATFKDEFVTCGGIANKEVDFRSMESKLIPGLYFGGEVLDVDGVTGGFNFQNCWTTGYIAGQAMARRILQDEEEGRKWRSSSRSDSA